MKHLFARYMKWKRQECRMPNLVIAVIQLITIPSKKMNNKNHILPIKPVTLFLFNSISFMGAKS